MQNVVIGAVDDWHHFKRKVSETVTAVAGWTSRTVSSALVPTAQVCNFMKAHPGDAQGLRQLLAGMSGPRKALVNPMECVSTASSVSGGKTAVAVMLEILRAFPHASMKQHDFSLLLAVCNPNRSQNLEEMQELLRLVLPLAEENKIEINDESLVTVASYCEPVLMALSDLIDPNTITLLPQAIVKDHRLLAASLLARGSDPNQRSLLPEQLTIDVYCQPLHQVKDVPNTCEPGQDTVLHLAVLCRRTEVIRQLVAAGGDLERTAVNGWTPLFYALRAARRSSSSAAPVINPALPGPDDGVVDCLLDLGANAFATDDSGRLPLYYCLEPRRVAWLRTMREDLTRALQGTRLMAQDVATIVVSYVLP